MSVILRHGAAGGALFVFLGLLPRLVLAAPTLVATETVANQAVGVNDQTASTTVTVANVAEVKASRTLTAASLPSDTESITIGRCVVTFVSVASTTSDETNCGDNNASIDITLASGDEPRPESEIDAALRSIINLTDEVHGELDTIGSGSQAVFQTHGTETSATAVSFTDGTGGNIASTASVPGVLPVAQVSTVTLSGTVEAGDSFTVTVPVPPASGSVTYTVTTADASLSDIATGLATSIQSSGGYASQAFTVAPSGGTVVFTATAAGTGFSVSASAANRTATAQTVTFAPQNFKTGYRFTIRLNGSDYSAPGSTVKAIVEALDTAIGSGAGVACTENDVVLTCTASTPGTGFTYETSVDRIDEETSGGSGSGSSGGSSSDRSSTPSPSTPARSTPVTLPPAPAVSPISVAKTTARTFSHQMSEGSNGAEVSALQERLRAEGVYTGPVTGYFGALTKAGVKAFQAKSGVKPATGNVGPLTLAALNRSTSIGTVVVSPASSLPAAAGNSVSDLSLLLEVMRGLERILGAL